MTLPRFLLIQLFPVLLLSGCGYTYRGDGHFVDHGIKNPSMRYSLTLSGIDLCKNHTYRFQIGRLPSSWWSGNFLYPRQPMASSEAEKIKDLIMAIKIEMKVFDRMTGDIVYDYTGWIKDVSEGLPGSPYDAGIGDAYINLEMVGHVFGLYDPKHIFGIPFGTYKEREVVISVVEPLTSLWPHCEAKLVLSNGGWK
jgi:hypothetical protein